MKKIVFMAVCLLMFFVISCRKENKMVKKDSLEKKEPLATALTEQQFLKAWNDLPKDIQKDILRAQRANDAMQGVMSRNTYTLSGYLKLLDKSTLYSYAPGAYGIEIKNASSYFHDFNTVSGQAYVSFYIYDANYNVISSSVGNNVNIAHAFEQGPTSISTDKIIWYLFWPSVSAGYITNY